MHDNHIAIDCKGIIMRVAIIGDGAMGTLFGALLSQGNEVSVLSRSAERSAARNERGITVQGRLYHPRFITDPCDAADPDLVIIFVKSADTESALENARPLLSGHSLLLTLQNGAGHERIMERFVPRGRIVIGKTEQNSTLVDGCTVLQGNPEGMTVLSPGGEDLVDAFAASSLPCAVSEDISRIVWRKLLTNSSLSAATGVLGSTIGFLGKSKGAMSLVRALLDEALSIAEADGYAFDRDEERRRIAGQCMRAGEARTSIERDLALGRKTEADFITGYVVRKADELGIAAPVQHSVLSILHAREDQNGSGR